MKTLFVFLRLHLFNLSCQCVVRTCHVDMMKNNSLVLSAQRPCALEQGAGHLTAAVKACHWTVEDDGGGFNHRFPGVNKLTFCRV